MAGHTSPASLLLVASTTSAQAPESLQQWSCPLPRLLRWEETKASQIWSRNEVLDPWHWRKEICSWILFWLFSLEQGLSHMQNWSFTWCSWGSPREDWYFNCRSFSASVPPSGFLGKCPLLQLPYRPPTIILVILKCNQPLYFTEYILKYPFLNFLLLFLKIQREELVGLDDLQRRFLRNNK